MPIRKLVGDEVGSRIPPVWGMNDEGELRGPWRELHGLPNMWLMIGEFRSLVTILKELTTCTGNLAWCRFYSKLIALRKSYLLLERSTCLTIVRPAEIKAKQEGLYGPRYSAPVSW